MSSNKQYVCEGWAKTKNRQCQLTCTSKYIKPNDNTIHYYCHHHIPEGYKKINNLCKPVIIILNVIIKYDITQFHFKDLYLPVYNEMGGYLSLYNRKKITKLGFEGQIRTIVEEHSADSCQHYRKSGINISRTKYPNIFSNEMLRIKNESLKWAPHRGGRTRDGMWKHFPGLGNPSEELLISYVDQMKVGMQGNRTHGKEIVCVHV